MGACESSMFSNVYKYYVAYKLATAVRDERHETLEAVE